MIATLRSCPLKAYVILLKNRGVISRSNEECWDDEQTIEPMPK